MSLSHAFIAAGVEWLSRNVGAGEDTGAVLGALVLWLREQGLPVDRGQLAIRTLHPLMVGRAFTWDRASGVTEVRLPHGALEQPSFLTSPLYVTFVGQREVRARIGSPTEGEYEIVRDLRERGFTDYLAVPLVLDGAPRATCTWATQAPGGFTDAQVGALRSLVAPLGLLVELHEARRTARDLLQTYLGARTGHEVLAGRVQLGDTRRLHAALWSCDLRGFTQLSVNQPVERVVEVLNRYFDIVATEVNGHHGEILKFVGDAVLAIFPVGDEGAGQACAHALAAAQAALDALGRNGLSVGVALHVGEVMYGNVGAPSRLDFTVIGQAVNLVSRIDGQCRPLGEPLLLSSQFVDALHTVQPQRSAREVATVSLHGMEVPQRLYALSRSVTATP